MPSNKVNVHVQLTIKSAKPGTFWKGERVARNPDDWVDLGRNGQDLLKVILALLFLPALYIWIALSPYPMFKKGTSTLGKVAAISLSLIGWFMIMIIIANSGPWTSWNLHF